MKNEDSPSPIRFHDFNARDPREVAELVATLLPLWAAKTGLNEWELTWRFQQLVRKLRYGAKLKQRYVDNHPDSPPRAA